MDICFNLSNNLLVMTHILNKFRGHLSAKGCFYVELKTEVKLSGRIGWAGSPMSQVGLSIVAAAAM